MNDNSDEIPSNRIHDLDLSISTIPPNLDHQVQVQHRVKHHRVYHYHIAQKRSFSQLGFSPHMILLVLTVIMFLIDCTYLTGMLIIDRYLKRLLSNQDIQGYLPDICDDYSFGMQLNIVKVFLYFAPSSFVNHILEPSDFFTPTNLQAAVFVANSLACVPKLHLTVVLVLTIGWIYRFFNTVVCFFASVYNIFLLVLQFGRAIITWISKLFYRIPDNDQNAPIVEQQKYHQQARYVPEEVKGNDLPQPEPVTSKMKRFAMDMLKKALNPAGNEQDDDELLQKMRQGVIDYAEQHQDQRSEQSPPRGKQGYLRNQKKNDPKPKDQDPKQGKKGVPRPKKGKQ